MTLPAPVERWLVALEAVDGAIEPRESMVV
jgi:hypothetical protein